MPELNKEELQESRGLQENFFYMKDLLLHIDPEETEEQINYRDKIMLMGSCFTEHIGNALSNSS